MKDELYRRCALAFTVVLAVSMPSAAQQKVAFDHANSNDRFRRVAVKHGDEIEITIRNTAGDNVFDYTIDVVLQQPGPLEQAQPPSYPATDKILKQMHDRRYGGYIVRARALPNIKTPVTVTKPGWTGTNTDTLFIVSVDSSGWDYEISGAFTVGFGFDDPKYAIREEASPGETEAKKIIVRDTEAEDEYRLGVGAMIHAYHHEYVPWLAGTFGIAINDGNRASYFVGPTLRLSSKAAFTAGASFTSVSRLPTGVKENDPATDDNVLNNLGSKVVNGWFFSFSYTFLNPGVDVLKKPFKGE